MMRLSQLSTAASLAFLWLSPNATVAQTAVRETSIEQLGAELASGKTTSRALVAAYLKRIERFDRAGPQLNSVIALNPDALAQADALDRERRAGHSRGALHGVPILIKDNIETADRMPTTAGSLALAENFAGRDAPVVKRLRDAGAIILGKTNLSEWANFRSNRSASGWSAVGGLTRNPYDPARSACGSSSGSGVAVAASFAAAAIGTETDGSITCPSAMNGLVGLKPTVGLVPGTGIVPISRSQDAAGPMARSVRDVSLLMNAIAGLRASEQPYSSAAHERTDYTARLSPGALRGRRIGVLHFAINSGPKTASVFEAALNDLKRAGAELVDIAELDGRQRIGDMEGIVLRTEFRADLDAYLASTPPAVTTRTLAALIEFNKAHAETELRWFGQETFEQANRASGLSDLQYLKARDEARQLAGRDGIDKLLRDYRVDLLVAPTTGPAWVNDLVNGDHFGGGGAGSLAAVSGYPHLTVPMGAVEGLPVGLSFIGPAWSEADLLSAGYAYEQASKRRVAPVLKGDGRR